MKSPIAIISKPINKRNVSTLRVEPLKCILARKAERAMIKPSSSHSSGGKLGLGAGPGV